ncbi:class I SAM-dependent methyltransferase [Streptomyces litchfieldiae]|uniref:Class I SAM-dependent methyltransferase n=1 Tax=Streptomyces litchfieldiae TaxID=3075543 RepID=A0ABU2MQ97_9ACTN|nr:class I SAM-dependent methyltransferase [Streptomyces sp. DSM 44938]MDT0343528.1 class I SAM-dependent methyltransferase [Streptomyces sp. DSM 44938]
MPTIPAEPAPPAGEQPHQHREMAESFGTDAERYDRARPRYPQALVDRIAAAPGPAVVDVGCGTGIAARQFAAAGRTVLGVEPDPRMARTARELGTEVEVATWEAWDPAGREFDAVVAGQAWHWIDPVAGAAKAARVLRPGGLLAPFWNVPRYPARLAEAVAEVCGRVLPDAPFDFRAMTRGALDGYQPILAGTADGIRRADAFGEPEQWRFDWEWDYTRDAWLDQMPTQGAFTRLEPAALGEVLAGVGAAIDAMGGGFTMSYSTVAVTAARTGAARPG